MHAGHRQKCWIPQPTLPNQRISLSPWRLHWSSATPLHTRTGPMVRHANISLIPAPAPGINERTLPDDAPSAAPHSGSELRRGNGADGRGVRQSHAIMVPDAGAEDFKDPRSRRGASHSRVAPKAVARQQPQELGLV